MSGQHISLEEAKRQVCSVGINPHHTQPAGTKQSLIQDVKNTMVGGGKANEEGGSPTSEFKSRPR